MHVLDYTRSLPHVDVSSTIENRAHNVIAYCTIVEHKDKGLFPLASISQI